MNIIFFQQEQNFRKLCHTSMTPLLYLLEETSLDSVSNHLQAYSDHYDHHQELAKFVQSLETQFLKNVGIDTCK